MTKETETKLFALLEQEFNAIALQQDMREIEHVVCADDIELINGAIAELRECYTKLGIDVSPLFTKLIYRSSEFIPRIHDLYTPEELNTAIERKVAAYQD